MIMKKVLAISSTLLGVVFLAGCGQQSVSQIHPTTPTLVAQQPAINQPVATQPTTTPVSQEPTAQSAQGVVYTNTQYGFQLTLPRGWENYRAVLNRTPGSSWSAIVSIEMPTSDKASVGYPDSTGKSLKGYYSMIRVLVYSNKEYEAEVARCKTANDPNCNVTMPGNAITGEGNTNVFAIGNQQAEPSADLQKLPETAKDMLKVLSLAGLKNK
jgi:hypothetical protein